MIRCTLTHSLTHHHTGRQAHTEHVQLLQQSLVERTALHVRAQIPQDARKHVNSFFTHQLFDLAFMCVCGAQR